MFTILFQDQSVDSRINIESGAKYSRQFYLTAYAHSAGPGLYFVCAGLWGCDVCVFCWPRWFQKALNIFKSKHLLMLFRYILGQGGTGEDPKIKKKLKQAKKSKREDGQLEKRVFFKGGVFCQKTEG